MKYIKVEGTTVHQSIKNKNAEVRNDWEFLVLIQNNNVVLTQIPGY